MPPVVAVHQVEPQAFISIREHCGQQQIPGLIGRALGALFQRLGDVGIAPSGQPFVIYHAYGSDGVDAEVAVPVRERVPEDGIVRNSTLPAMTVARIVHVGPYERIGPAYTALSTWVQDHGYRTSGLILERYLVGPGDDVPEREFRTEIEMPLALDAVAAPV